MSAANEDLRLDLLAELACSGLDAQGEEQLRGAGGVDEERLFDYEQAAAALHLALLGELEQPPEDLLERLHSDARAQRLERGGLLAGPGSGALATDSRRAADAPRRSGPAAWMLAVAAGLLVALGAYHLRAMGRADRERSDLLAQLEDARGRADGLAGDLRDATAEGTRLEQELAAARTERDDFGQQLVDAAAQRDALGVEREELVRQLDQARQQNEALAQQNREHAEELDQAYNRYEQAVLELALMQNPPPPSDRREALLANANDALYWKWSAAGDPTGQGVEGNVVWSPSRQEGYMTFEGLTKNDPLKERFQLWIFDAERPEATPVDGGVFDVNAEGTVVVAIDPKLPIESVAAFAVTVERPEGVVVSDRTRLALLAAK